MKYVEELAAYKKTDAHRNFIQRKLKKKKVNIPVQVNISLFISLKSINVIHFSLLYSTCDILSIRYKILRFLCSLKGFFFLINLKNHILQIKILCTDFRT